VLLIIDISRKLTEDDLNLINLIKDKTVIVVINKVDLPAAVDDEEIKALLSEARFVKISALKQEGIEELKNTIYEVISDKMGFISDEGIITADERQRRVLDEGRKFLEGALAAIDTGMPIEMVEIDIRDAWEKLGEITGDTISDEIINTIFQKFCIGK
ncbi:MAG TPA: tRNA uridine-5-carboxymethylaminomethyl(34) synthesis GTPase MnmE, partial [Tepidanaerobacter syntrophicus]|nr:tRNA uridine-5-carboxymethylaminomethyl(34) synthesis GTPase MnmE [Tepidanaerobacter syntrophicus]